MRLPQVGLGLLLLIELLALMVSFDTQGLDAIPTVWAQLVNWAPQLLRIAVTVAAAILALAVTRHPAESRAFLATKPIGSRVPLLGVHAVALGLFAFVTSTIVAIDDAYVTHPALWTIAWLFTGVVAVVAWALALFPLRAWLDVGMAGRRSIGWGLAVGIMAWASGFLTQAFWIPLARYTFAVVAWIVNLLYPLVTSVPDRLVVGTPAFRVRITPECSGYEGIGLILVFLSAYLWLFRRHLRFPAALILLPIGAVAIWLANIVRIVALIAIGSAGWTAVALGGFHSQAGWIAFTAIALAFVALTNRFGPFRKAGASVLAF